MGCNGLGGGFCLFVCLFFTFCVQSSNCDLLHVCDSPPPPPPPPSQPAEAEVQTDYANLRRNRSSECILVGLKSLLYENRLCVYFLQVYHQDAVSIGIDWIWGMKKLGRISLEENAVNNQAHQVEAYCA